MKRNAHRDGAARRGAPAVAVPGPAPRDLRLSCLEMPPAVAGNGGRERDIAGTGRAWGSDRVLWQAPLRPGRNRLSGCGARGRPGPCPAAWNDVVFPRRLGVLGNAVAAAGPELQREAATWLVGGDGAFCHIADRVQAARSPSSWPGAAGACGLEEAGLGAADPERCAPRADDGASAASATTDPDTGVCAVHAIASGRGAGDATWARIAPRGPSDRGARGPQPGG